MPIARFEMPDGRVARFEVPAGLSPEQAQNLISQQISRTPVEAPKPPPERTKTEAITDVAAPFVSGIGSLLKIPGQVYGLTTGAIKNPDFSTTGLQGVGTDIQEWAKKQYSEKLKAEQAETERKVAEAEKEGQIKAFTTGLGEVVSSPLTQLPAFVAEQLPQAIPSMIAAAIPGVGPAAAAELRAAQAAASKLAQGTAARKAADAAVKIAADDALKSAIARRTTAAIGTGAVQQGADIGEGSYQEIKDYLMKQKNMPEPQASEEALKLARMTGVAGAGASLLAQKLPGAKAFEKALAGEKLGTGRLMGAATGALKNIPDELAEEVGGKLAQNVALQQVNPEQSLTAGLGSTAAQAALGATAIGGGAGALAGGKPAVSKQELQEAEDLKRRQELTEKAKAERELIAQQLDITKNPLGQITPEELGPVLAKRVEEHRLATGKPALTAYSLEDVIDALPAKNRAALSAGQNADLNALIGAKTGHTTETYTPDDLTNIAKEKNIDVTTQGFTDFLQRSTGMGEPALMSQPQLHAAITSLQKLPTFKQTQSLPEGSNATRYSDEQYNKAIEGLNTAMDNVGADELDFKNVTKAVETATGLKGSAVNDLLNDATRKGDIVTADKKVSIPSRAMPSGYNVEENIGEEQETADSYDIMRGDEKLFSAPTEEGATKAVESLQRTTDSEVKRVDAELKSQQDKIAKSEDELNKLTIEGKFGTPEYTAAEAKHQELLDASWPVIAELTAKKESYETPLSVTPVGTKKIKPKTYTVRKGERTVKEAADRAAAEEEIFKDLTDQELQDLSKKRSPALLKRVNAEIQRRASEPKPEPKKLTPELEQQRKVLEENLPKLLAKFGLEDVGLKIMDAISEGAEGSYAAKVIQIALDASNPVRVLRHESLHALKELGFFTPQQWAALEREAKAKWVDKYLKGQKAYMKDGSIASRYDAYVEQGLNEADILEEAIADAFGDFDVNKAPPGMISALLNKLRNFFSTLKAYLNGQGYEDAKDIFKKIEKGELKATQPVKAEGEIKLSLAPEGIPQKLWDLHNKAMEADEAASTWNAGSRKANATKASNRLVRAVNEYFPDDYQAQMAIMTRMNEESSKRGEGFFGTPKYSLSGIGVPLSTRNLMEVQTPVAQQELGLNTEAVRGRFNNVREIAKALNQYTLDHMGPMDRNDFSSQESSRIARAIADEVAYQLRSQSKTGTGLGWYSTNYPKAVKRLASRFPELSDSKHARSVFSALVAVTSNGEKVTKNIDNAIKLYAELRQGKPLVAMGNRRATALENNLKVIQDLLNEHGEDFEKVLLKEITVKEMNARLREMGQESDGSYLANTVVPAAAVYFGPKLGAFYANLSGSEGYLTMDLWWTRSINRMRGLLMPKATDASINKFRDMMDKPDATRDEVTAATIPLRNKYEEYGWNTELEHLVKAKEPAKKNEKDAWFKKAKAKAGDAYEQLLYEHNLEKMANTIYKNEFEMLEEAPFSATDRKFMYDAGRKAQDILRKEGIDLTLADIQAALWYYEKRLYEKLSGRKADDIGYEEAIIAQASEGNGRAKPSVVFNKEPDRGNEPGGKVEGAEGVRGEPDEGKEKLSLRTYFPTAEEAENAAYKKAPPTTEAFKRWFGKSKAVEEGRPMVMYHASPADFNTFFDYKPIFISPDPKEAEFFGRFHYYGDERATKPINIYPLWVRAENSFDFENPKHVDRIHDALVKEIGEDFITEQSRQRLASGDWSYIEDESVQQAIKDAGFDSFYVLEGDTKNLAVFGANQVKSATGNSGEFGETKDMRFSLRTVPLSPDEQQYFDTVFDNKADLADLHEYVPSAELRVSADRMKSELVFNEDDLSGLDDYLGDVWAGAKKQYGGEGASSLPKSFSSAGNKFLKKARAAEPKYSLREAPDTPEFKRWFGDSKVVDEDGQPLVVYHGSPTFKGNQFIDDVERKNRAGNVGGFYFTPYADEASDYAADRKTRQYQEGSQVVPVYLSIKNPYIAGESRVTPAMRSAYLKEMIASNQHMSKERATEWAKTKVGFFTDGRLPSADALNGDGDAMQRILKVGGYDGFKDGRHWIAFDPTQIKSATGNVGTYDVTNPDIRRSLRVAEDIKQMPNGVNAHQSIIEKTTAREEEGFVERILKAISPEGRASFRQKAINRYEGMSVNDKKIADQMGGIELLADSSAEAAALQSDTAAGIAAAAMGYGDSPGGVPVYDKGYTTISDLNGTVKGLTEILRPLAVHGDPFIYRAYQFYAGVKRGTRLMADGKEKLFDQADIQYAKDLEQLYPEFKTVQQEWTKYNDGLVDYMVKTGVLTTEKGRLFKKYGDYVPFYRQLEGEETIGPNIFQSMSGVKQPKKVKGSEAPLADFLETVVRNTQAAIQAGTKNVAAQRAINQALTLGTAGQLPQVTSAPNTVTILENGVPTSYAVADKLLYDSMQSLHLPEMPFLSILSAPANLLRNMVTKDPGFMLANLMRDSLSAYATSGANMTPLIDTFANFGKVMADRSPEFQALINAGVIGGYEFSRGVPTSGKALAKDLRKKTGTQVGAEKTFKPITSLWDLLEKGTEASDAATRIAVYKDVMARTGNEAEAIRQALEVMNFNRKGSSPIIRVITAAIPFLNARIQGLDVLYRAGFAPTPEGLNKTDRQREVQKNFFIRGATMMALSSMYWFMMKDDDEYKKQEQEVRDNNWLLPGLGVRMPIPFEVGVLFKVVPERILEYSFGNDTGEDLAKSMERALRSTFAVNYIPQTVLPLVEATTNYSYFTMRPIVGQGMEGVRPGLQTGPGTTKIAETIGKTINQSPILIDHIIQGYTGTMGMYLVNAVDSILDSVSDVQKPSSRPDQYPIVKRFLMNPEAKGSVSAYYELKNAVDETVRTMNLLEKTGRGEDLTEFMQGKHRLFGMSNAKLYGVKDYLSSVDKNMKVLQDAATKIRASNMSP